MPSRRFDIRTTFIHALTLDVWAHECVFSNLHKFLLCLVPCRFDIRTTFIHDLTLDVWAHECVFSNGKGTNLNTDMHRGGGWSFGARATQSAPLQRTTGAC